MSKQPGGKTDKPPLLYVVGDLPTRKAKAAGESRQSVAPNSDDKSIDRHIGAEVRKLREQRGLSQKDFSAFLRMSPKILDNHENGRSRIGADALVVMAGVLGVQPSVLFQNYVQPALGSAASPPRDPDSEKDADGALLVAQYLRAIIRDAQRALTALESAERAKRQSPNSD